MFGLALRHSISYFFFLHRSPSSFCTAFDVVLSNRGEVRLVIPSAYVYVFRDFNVHHKDFLTYSGGTDRPGELCHNFCHLTMVNFPTRILDCDSTALPFWIYFFSWPYFFWSCFNFHRLSFKTKQGCSFSSYSLWLFSGELWLMVVVIIWEMLHGRISLNLVLLRLLLNFVCR